MKLIYYIYGDELMVPLSERRHRLYRREIPEVNKGLRLRCLQLLENREDEESAEIAFRTLYRLTREEPGRPKYPKFTWNILDHFLEYYEEEIEAGMRIGAIENPE